MAEHITRARNYWKSKPSNSLQKLGIISSIVLSALAVFLTFMYGENQDQINQLIRISKQQDAQIRGLKGLSDENKDQIHQLTILSQKQDSEISSLDSIYGEDKHQTTNSDISVDQIKHSNERLVVQTTLLGSAVAILTKDQQKAFELQSLSDKAYFMALRFANERLIDMNDSIVREAIQEPDPNENIRTKCLEHFKRVLETQLTNIYLLRHPKIADEWAHAWFSAENSRSFQFEYVGTDAHSTNDKGETVYIPQDLDRDQLVSFKGMINDIKELQRDVETQQEKDP